MTLGLSIALLLRYGTVYSTGHSSPVDCGHSLPLQVPFPLLYLPRKKRASLEPVECLFHSLSLSVCRNPAAALRSLAHYLILPSSLHPPLTAQKPFSSSSSSTLHTRKTGLHHLLLPSDTHSPNLQSSQKSPRSIEHIRLQLHTSI